MLLVTKGNKQYKRDTPVAVLAIASESVQVERGHRKILYYESGSESRTRLINRVGSRALESVVQEQLVRAPYAKDLKKIF